MSETKLTISDLICALNVYDKSLDENQFARIRLFADESGSVGYGDKCSEEYSFIDIEDAHSWLLNENREYDGD